MDHSSSDPALNPLVLYRYRPVTSVRMQKILDAILADDLAAVGSLPVPDSYRGVTVRADEVEMFAGLRPRDKDPRRSLHVDEVADARARARARRSSR